jgi:para-aminobenzoate synthetase component I
VKFRHKLTFNSPLNLANAINRQSDYVAFLYSGAKHSYSGTKSYLAWGVEKLTTSNSELELALTESKDVVENMWFGYFAYEFNHAKQEKLTIAKKSHLNNDELLFFKPKNLIIFEHNTNIAKYYSVNNTSLDINELVPQDHHFTINNLSSNISRTEYLAKVVQIREDISAGSYYQANLTRKFYGEISGQDNFAIFSSLCKESPAPYASYLKLADFEVISSSPERFINIDKSGLANTRPIKGTIKRTSNSKIKLKKSRKDQAENLMIVDLMRNDLGKLAKLNSVTTDSLFDIDSFSNLHHMSSSISAQKNSSSLALITSSLPPGSMTGAPKIASMQAITKLELQQRGVYSGIIGYFGGDGSADFSVVIRTIIIQGNYFEFQVGGGIIYDSEPEKELLETYIKAKAICKTLNISELELDNL